MSRLFQDAYGYLRIHGKEKREQIANEIIERIIKKLDDAVKGGFCVNKELGFKENFGDIDFLINGNIFLPFALMVCKDWFRNDKEPIIFDEGAYTGTWWIEGISKNANIVSFLYCKSKEEKYHVDFILSNNMTDYCNNIAYYSNNVVNNVMGQFLRAHSIKAGHNGIFYEYVDSRKQSHYIKFEDDYRGFFLMYFGVDVVSLEFETQEALYSFLHKLPFFPGSEKYKKMLTHDTRTNIKKNGILSDIYEYLSVQENTEPTPVVLMEHHKKIVDAEIVKIEKIIEINKLKNEEIENFIKKFNICDCKRSDAFKTIHQDYNKNFSELNFSKYMKISEKELLVKIFKLENVFGAEEI